MSKRVPPSGSRPPRPDGEAPRANRPRAVAELLPAVGAAALRRFGFVQSSIVSRWAEIVGERLAGASRPESIRFPAGKKLDGTLTLVARGAHAPMLQHITPEITERVNRFFGYAAVARIAIRQGEVAPPPARRAPPSLRPMPADTGAGVSADMIGGLRAIADPELRAVLESLAAGVASSQGVPRIS